MSQSQNSLSSVKECPVHGEANHSGSFCSQCKSDREAPIEIARKTADCLLCSAPFFPRNKTQLFCSNPHATQCHVCGTDINPVPRKGKVVYACSKRTCKVAVTKETNMKRYGVANVSQSDSTRAKLSAIHQARTVEEIARNSEKSKATNRARYGTDFATQSAAVRDKTVATNLDRYGVENPAQVEEFQNKAKATNLDRYGVEHSFQAESVKDKIDATNLERYGTVNPRWENEASVAAADETNIERYGSTVPATTDIVKRRIVDSNLDRYGVEHSFQAESVKDKIVQTNLDRYGVQNPMQSPAIVKKMQDSFMDVYGVARVSQKHMTNFDDYANFPDFVKKQNWTIRHYARHFSITENSVRRTVRHYGVSDHIVGIYTSSALEAEFVADMQSRNILTTYVRNDRTVLKGKELNFYFPDHKLAVEISPTSTHNTIVSWGGRPSTIDANYHKNKFLECAAQGIELITIFDWMPWDKVLAMIAHKLQSNSATVFARKATYVEFDKISSTVREFVKKHHVLGLAKNLSNNSTVGTLVFDGELIAVAVWSERADSYELKRMVFHSDFSVPGGASKLLKNFQKRNTTFDKILTYSDCDLGTGNIYGTLGFELVSEARPNLNHYNIKSGHHIKHLSLVKQGADRLLRNVPGYVAVGMGDNLPNNVEIVEANGYLPVYDCGYRTWVLKRQ